MKIAVAVKVLPNDEDIFVAPDCSLDYSKAHETISVYDLNAIEAAAQLAETYDGSVVVVSASEAGADDLKVKKSILSRGVDEMFMVADDAMKNLEARPTAQVLAHLLKDKVADYDLVICGDGSADLYAGQVDVQLASILGIPVINGVTSIHPSDSKVIVERTFDDEIEELEIPLPAVVSVSPDIALPRIAGMREILAAGKKPADITSLDASGATVESTVANISVMAPTMAERKQQIFHADNAKELDAFATAVADALR